MLTLYVLPPPIEIAHQPVEACRLLRAQHPLASGNLAAGGSRWKDGH